MLSARRPNRLSHSGRRSARVTPPDARPAAWPLRMQPVASLRLLAAVVEAPVVGLVGDLWHRAVWLLGPVKSYTGSVQCRLHFSLREAALQSSYLQASGRTIAHIFTVMLSAPRCASRSSREVFSLSAGRIKIQRQEGQPETLEGCPP